MTYIKLTFYVFLTFNIVSCNKTTKVDSVADAPPGKDSVVKVDNDMLTNDDLIANIRKVITTKYLKPEDLKVIDSTERKFSLQEIDLNNDGKKEVFINFSTPYFCGSGGCSLLLLNSDLGIINRFTVTETPLYISPDYKNGWKVILVKSKGKWKALEYEKGKYPSNPSVVKDSNAEPDSKSSLIFSNQKDSQLYNF